MIHFFGNAQTIVYAVQADDALSNETIKKLEWLFGHRTLIPHSEITPENAKFFIGPRIALITPWSTNAVEVTQNMNIKRIQRIEEFKNASIVEGAFDKLLSQKFTKLDQDIFKNDLRPEAIFDVDDIAAYNAKEGLGMSPDEVAYLENLSEKLGRKLTDSEVFGFSQVNSEHCRHKIFNGTFIIDGQEMPSSLFDLIKKTSAKNPNDIVSAYKDNVAFIRGPKIKQWAPKSGDKPDWYQESDFKSVISLKAETHNFPTTVEPYNGAATGGGGEVRDRLAGGRGSLPLAGTAVYMTSYTKLDDNRPWEKAMEAREWLYQTPLDILMKATDGASNFGNTFGQPLITGSILTFEHEEDARKLGFDKVIMQAGGVGYAKANQAIKGTPKKGDKIVVLGGDNYRIGMGGASVSSADTEDFGSEVEINAIQRNNAEMQMRVANTIRTMVESEDNPIISIHDHGAGGHLNCLSELVEDAGGKIDLDRLPVGDPSLSAKEILGNESQERMGLVIGKDDIEKLQKVADRERAPMYRVGRVTGDKQFSFVSDKGEKPIDFEIDALFGSDSKTVMKDKTVNRTYKDVTYDVSKIKEYVGQLFRLEAVGSKDWIINKVDRSGSGKVAMQQTVGELQLPLNNCGVMALDFSGTEGVATTIGHAPIAGLIDPKIGSRVAIAESLTNIVWAPLKDGLQSVSLSANWMWPANNEGEDARLYAAVKEVSDFSIDLGINVPTGKDSLSMKQNYENDEVIAPGTVVISTVANCTDVKKIVSPLLKKDGGSIYYINISQDDFKLGGSSFGQIRNAIGKEAPTVKSTKYLKTVFNALQELINDGKIAAGHDVSAGGLITTLLEMCFADLNLGASLDLSAIKEDDLAKVFFAENTAVVIQATDDNEVEKFLASKEVDFVKLGNSTTDETLRIKKGNTEMEFNIPEMRDQWMQTSKLMDGLQSGKAYAQERFDNYKKQPLRYTFPSNFNGKLPDFSQNKNRPKAAIIREKGSNSEREMAYMLHLAGFDVKDVHMTDLTTGREDLKDIQMLVAVGGFTNSDVFGSAKGWAGTFLYNEKAHKALTDFFAKEDSLSLGVCNGGQLFIELGLLHPEDDDKPRLLVNKTNKFESVFSGVTIQENNSVMLSSLAGCTLGIWSAHGEGRFSFPKEETHYNIVAKYAYDKLPASPNGSDFNTAMITDKTGRHLVMMPHLERGIFPWNWPHYPADRKQDEVTPWLSAMINAKKWLEEKK